MLGSRARRAQFPRPSLRHRHGDSGLRPPDRRHESAGVLHAQDDPRPARAREIRGALRRRLQSSVRARRRDPHQGQPHCGRGRHPRGARQGAGGRRPLVKIEIEVDTLEQLREVLDTGRPTSCCSTTWTLRPEAAVACGRAGVTEASGGITPANAADRRDRGRSSLIWSDHPFRTHPRLRPRHRDVRSGGLGSSRPPRPATARPKPRT